MINENLKWLLKWFHSHCDGEWEVDQAICMGTLGNPGWYLEVRIVETELENRPFRKINDIERSEHDWIACSIKEGKFKGYGGPFNFDQVLQAFRDWAEGGETGTIFPPEHSRLSPIAFSPAGYQANMALIEDNLTWLINWFYSQCYENWESAHTILMYNTKGSNWYLWVSIDETELADQPFREVDIKRTETDWVHCKIKKAIEKDAFEGNGGPCNLPEMIQVFRDWAQSIYSKA